MLPVLGFGREVSGGLALPGSECHSECVEEKLKSQTGWGFRCISRGAVHCSHSARG
jgi:hypothetical protein